MTPTPAELRAQERVRAYLAEKPATVPDEARPFQFSDLTYGDLRALAAEREAPPPAAPDLDVRAAAAPPAGEDYSHEPARGRCGHCEGLWPYTGDTNECPVRLRQALDRALSAPAAVPADAELGRLLREAREAYGDPHLFVRYVGGLPPSLKPWRVYVKDVEISPDGDTELDALRAALAARAALAGKS
jgi:hypothetical protein